MLFESICKWHELAVGVTLQIITLEHYAQLELKSVLYCWLFIIHCARKVNTLIVCELTNDNNSARLFLCKFHALTIVMWFSHIHNREYKWPSHDGDHAVRLFTCSLISLTARNSFFNFMRRFWNLWMVEIVKWGISNHYLQSWEFLPNLNLSLGETECMCNLDPSSACQIVVEVELFLELERLKTGVCLSATSSWTSIRSCKKRKEEQRTIGWVLVT